MKANFQVFGVSIWVKHVLINDNLVHRCNTEEIFLYANDRYEQRKREKENNIKEICVYKQYCMGGDMINVGDLVLFLL